MSAVSSSARADLIRRGLQLEYLTVSWNLVEGAAAMVAAIVAGSVALLAFGLDSFVETASAAIIVWRLVAESGAPDDRRIEVLERRAQRLVATSLVALAVYIVYDAVTTLLGRVAPDASPFGVAITVLSLGVMWWLARLKRRTAIALGSRAMQADAFQATACAWLALAVLVGVGLNTIFGFWWADPVAALIMPPFLWQEAREAWRGEESD